jgi:hypothetical protein
MSICSTYRYRNCARYRQKRILQNKTRKDRNHIFNSTNPASAITVPQSALKHGGVKTVICKDHAAPDTLILISEINRCINIFFSFS